MANPAPTAGFEVWYGDRVAPTTSEPKTGNTGDFEVWYGDRLWLDEYVAAAVSAAYTPRLALLGVG